MKNTKGLVLAATLDCTNIQSWDSFSSSIKANPSIVFSMPLEAFICNIFSIFSLLCIWEVPSFSSLYELICFRSPFPSFTWPLSHFPSLTLTSIVAYRCTCSVYSSPSTNFWLHIFEGWPDCSQVVHVLLDWINILNAFVVYIWTKTPVSLGLMHSCAWCIFAPSEYNLLGYMVIPDGISFWRQR